MLSTKQIIARLLKEDLTDRNVLTDLLSMALEVEKEDNQYAKDLAKRVSKLVLNQCNETGDILMYDLYNKTLLYLAQHHKDFDSYMLYVEKDRDPQQKFYLPRRKQLYGIVQQLQRMIDDELDLMTISLPPGTGKAQPLYSKVLTPDGFIPMGDIKVGQKVISGLGKICDVIGVFPQGIKAIYEITLSNGSKVRCSGDHLWRTRHEDSGWRDIYPTHTETLETIYNNLGKIRYYIPILDTENLGNLSLDEEIVDIKYIGGEECQCIFIDDPSHLYITDDFIITHNTTLEEFFASFVMGHEPNKPNVFSSFSGFMTKMFYDAVTNIIGGTEYCWGDIFPDVKIEGTNAKEETLNLDKWQPFKTLTCRPINASLTGNTRCEGYLFVDDLVSGIEEALSKERLDKLYNKYGTDLKTRKKKGCKEIHIATRWSVHDVIGRLQRQYEGDGRSEFIAIPDLDPVTGESNFNYNFGVGYDKKYFDDVAATMDDVSYRCLYKNAPIEREGLLYHPEELRRYLGELPDKEPDAILAVCDTKDTGDDYNSLMVFYQYGDDYYLEDLVFKNIDPGTLDELNSDMLVKHNVQECQFESNKEGSRTASRVAELVKEKGGRCHITKKYTTQNKETKIIVNSSWVKTHILFKDQSEYSMKDDYGVMMSQLCSYSQVGSHKKVHDDAPDCLSIFALFASGIGGAKVKITSRSALGF